jgi:hypothetical protein
MKVQVQKNDEHKKAQRRKKIKIAMFQNNKL